MSELSAPAAQPVERQQAELRATDPFLPVTIIGGQGGNDFFFCGGKDGSLLEKIGVWVGGWQVKAIKIWLTNGSIRQFGNPSGPYKEYAFQPGERITSMSLWGNGAGTRLGAIKFKTSNGSEFFAKMTEWGLKQEYPVDIGSGLCVGVMGRAGSDIDCMGFIFVRPVRDSVMVDMHYPTLGITAPSVSPQELYSTVYDNKLDVEQKYTVTTERELIHTESWQKTVGFEAALSISVKAGVPKVFEGSAGWQFKIGDERTWKQENVEKKTEKWEFPITVPAGKKVEINVSIGRADVSLAYQAKVRLTTTDNSVLEFDVHGTYEGITYTQATISVRAIN